MFVFIGAIIISTGFVFSQTEDDRTNFLDGQFFLVEEDYSEALSAFQKVYKGEYVDNANLNYLIGTCYLRISGQKNNAIKYLEKAITSVSPAYVEGSFKEVNAPIEAHLLLGNAYRISEDLEKAVQQYNKYRGFLKDNEIYKLQYVDQQLANCARAKEAFLQPVNYKTESLGNLYNSSFNNFNAVRSGDGRRMAYMSEQRFYDAIYFAEITNGSLSNAINITPQIQSDGDQYVTSLSYDGNTMYLSRIGIDDADIMTSTYVARRWTKSESIGKPINSRYFESHASISADGKRLFFLSNRKESLGGMDIFYSDLKDDGKSWSEPVNLGPTINTKLNEDSPFISLDGKTLYFSSEGHESIGGYDIFYSELDENNNWSTPVPYPYPLNTTDDDIFFFPFEDGQSGYMALIQPSGMGGDDIYTVSIVSDEEMAEQNLAEETEKIPEEVEVAEEVAEVEEMVEETLTQETEIMEAEEVLPAVTYHVKPVFFGFDSYALTSEAKAKLTVAKEVMIAFPDLKLQVSAHTDAIGSESYNQLLSSRRAKAVIDYLIESGVPENRLSLKAEGETNPVAANRTVDGMDSSVGRKFNRRAEFKILSGNYDQIILEEVVVPDNLKIK